MSRPEPLQGDVGMSTMERFLGGSVLGVTIRLVAASIAVGVVLSWLNITPWDLLQNLRESLIHLYERGYYIFRDLFGYFAIGAVVVIPIWLILRLTKSVPGKRG